jgi:hypothetical protein
VRAGDGVADGDADDRLTAGELGEVDRGRRDQELG